MQLKKLIVEMDAAMKAMSAHFADMAQKVAITDREKGLLEKSSAELHSSATRKVAWSACMGGSFFELVPIMYLGFALRAEKGFVPYCRREVLELFF